MKACAAQRRRSAADFLKTAVEGFEPDAGKGLRLKAPGDMATVSAEVKRPW